jgi:hypothetical protein
LDLGLISLWVERRSRGTTWLTQADGSIPLWFPTVREKAKMLKGAAEENAAERMKGLEV